MDYEQSFDNACKYLEWELMKCPARYDRKLYYKKCENCSNFFKDRINKSYNANLSVECWKQALAAGEGK